MISSRSNALDSSRPAVRVGITPHQTRSRSRPRTAGHAEPGTGTDRPPWVRPTGLRRTPCRRRGIAAWWARTSSSDTRNACPTCRASTEARSTRSTTTTGTRCSPPTGDHGCAPGGRRCPVDHPGTPDRAPGCRFGVRTADHAGGDQLCPATAARQRAVENMPAAVAGDHRRFRAGPAGTQEGTASTTMRRNSSTKPRSRARGHVPGRPAREAARGDDARTPGAPPCRTVNDSVRLGPARSVRPTAAAGQQSPQGVADNAQGTSASAGNSAAVPKQPKQTPRG